MKRSDDNSSLDIQKLVVGQMAVNCYLLVDHETNESIIVDPGDDAEYIMTHLKNTSLKCILVTHGHFDHIMAAFALQASYHVPVFMHEKDTFLLARMKETAQHFLGVSRVDPPPVVHQSIDENDTITLGTHGIGVIHTPGHTPGSVCFYLRKQQVLFVGDLVFAGGGVGRVDFSYSSKGDLRDSLRRILDYHPLTLLYPGHGNSTTIQAEQGFHMLS